VTSSANVAFVMAPGRTHGMTKVLLACGAIAGPIYVIVGLLQILFREGFDVRRHALSLLSNGNLGWIQIANFILSGVLVLAGAVGIRRAIYPGRASTWGTILLAIYGLGLVGAGIFVADPALGFPPDATDQAPSVSVQGVLHFVSGAMGFFAFVGACLVFTRRFSGLRQYGWALFSLATGILFCAAFFGIASGSGSALVVIAFYLAVLLAWSWITAIFLYLMFHHFRSEGNVGGIGNPSWAPMTESGVGT
jgi:hypothetical protein